MEKGPSEYAKYWTSPYDEVNHFYSHADEMGIFKIIEYSKKAVEFLNHESDSIIAFKANEKKFNSTYKYDVVTNEFMIISTNDKIVTYYEPDEEIVYFYRQFRLYGDYWIKRDYRL